MTDAELMRLAHYIVMEQASDERWMKAYARAQSALNRPVRRLVTAKRAAEILGISVWQLYRIKDDEEGRPRFTYVKGTSKCSPLRFDETALIEEYERYLRSQ